MKPLEQKFDLIYRTNEGRCNILLTFNSTKLGINNSDNLLLREELISSDKFLLSRYADIKKFLRLLKSFKSNSIAIHALTLRVAVKIN